MADHKRQHYVPRLYLEMFAGEDLKAVGVYSIASRRLIPNAPIKRQAYRNYFYGSDGRAERILSDIESKAGPVLKRIRERHELPEPLGPEHESLLFFLAMQHCRTVGAEALHQEGAEKTLRAMLTRQATLEGNTRILDALPRVRLKRVNAIAESLRAAFIGTSLLTDLALLLVVNESGTALIGSDAPVALHNRIFEGHGRTNAAGYGSVGLQIAFPLGPRHLLLCYDPFAYAVEGAEDRIVRVAEDGVISLLNDLQWEAAEALLFVSSETSSAMLAAGAERWEEARKGERMEFREEVVEESETRVHVRQGVGERPSRVPLELPFLVEQIRARGDPGPFDIAPLRDPAKMDLITGLHEVLSDIADVLHGW